jgi:hypothetical protein
MNKYLFSPLTSGKSLMGVAMRCEINYRVIYKSWALSEKLFFLSYKKSRKAQTLVYNSLYHGEYYPKFSCLHPEIWDKVTSEY